MHPLLRYPLGVTFAALAFHAAAAPISQDAAAPSGDIASAASRLVTDDTGDAARLARMVDEVARNAGAASSSSGRSSARQAPAPRDSHAPSSAKEGDDAGPAEAPQRPAWLGGDDNGAQGTPPVGRGRADSGGPAPGTLLDQVDPEERNQMREIVYMIKSVLYHPMTWIIGVLVVAGSAVLSVGGRRRK